MGVFVPDLALRLGVAERAGVEDVLSESGSGSWIRCRLGTRVVAALA